MPYQRPLFATFACLYCLVLGSISLYSNPKSKVHRLFALYNFSLALYNCADYALLFSNHNFSLWYVRLVSPAGAFMTYYFLRFTYEISGYANTKTGKKIISVARIVAITFGILYLTPLMLKDVNVQVKLNPGLEIPGPLYFVYGFAGIWGLVMALFPLWNTRKNATEIQKKQITYVFAACFAGIVALGSYVLSVFWIDLPWLYYSLEALVGFILIYAIFESNLIPIAVALRRVLLVLGVYLGLAMVIIPMAYYSFNSLIAAGPTQYVFYMLFFGLLLSLGPIIYANVVRHVSIFQDTSVSYLTHELKSPLAAIQSAKLILADELTQSSPDSSKVQNYLEMIERNSVRLEKYVLDILNFQKTGAVTEGEEKEHVSAADIVRECLTLWPSAHERVRLNVVGDVTLLANREGLQQIFSNLISNSFRHAPTGRVTVSLERKPDALHVSISDEGPGISQEELATIFNPFTKTKGSTSNKSTGLGLAIAQKWVLAHGGKIWAESDGDGKGTRVRVRLPG
jgi:signal transduction histidine kinase